MDKSSRSIPSNNYTLAGSPVWQELQRSKPITQFSLREREFIKDSLTSDWEQDFTGTRVMYIEPEGSDHMSMISRDDNDDELHKHQPNAPGKGKFKKMAKRLYPAKVVGSAKVIGGAIRHPMVTGRKMNPFVQNATGSSRNACDHQTMGRSTNAALDNLPPLTRSATMNEIHHGKEETSPGLSFL